MFMYNDKKHDFTYEFACLYLQITPHFYIFSIPVKKCMHVSNYIIQEFMDTFNRECYDAKCTAVF